MNILPVMGKDSFSEMNKDIAVSYSKVATDCMLEAANDTAKCLDYKMMSKKCPLCTLWESCKGTDAYGKFVDVIRDSHECSINHDGLAGSMEAKGVGVFFYLSQDVQPPPW